MPSSYITTFVEKKTKMAPTVDESDTAVTAAVNQLTATKYPNNKLAGTLKQEEGMTLMKWE